MGYNHFYAMKNPEGTYRIECMICIYREKFGKHPDFLKDLEGDAHTGFNTKYALLVRDDIDSEVSASALASDYNHQYDDLITSCEDTSDWKQFPFKDCEPIYYR